MSNNIANAVVGQSGGPTAAINATLAGVIKMCLEEKDKIGTLYGMKNGIAGFMNESMIDLTEYFAEIESELELLASTPAAALGSCRKKLGEEEPEKIYSLFEKYNIRYFFYIGGNDSMDTVAKLAKYAQEHPGTFDVKLIGIPKTIDNDLVLTDHTPGFGSAAKFVAATMQELIRDCSVYLVKSVTIVEIMGRDAGWLTAASAITGYVCGTGPDLIYVPEADFDEDKFIGDVNLLLENGEKPYVVIAVSEGIRTADGTYVAQKAEKAFTDGFGHSALSGVGKYLEELVKVRIGCKCRSVELNITQRCASHIASKTDIDESKRIGSAAVRHALNGETGKMMSIRRVKASDKYKVEFFAEDVIQTANKIKKIPSSYLSDDGKGVNQKCIDYMLPLIYGENPVIYEDGLPVHFEF